MSSKPPCLYPLENGERCCECSTCQPGCTPAMQRDDAIEALYATRAKVASLQRDMARRSR